MGFARHAVGLVATAALLLPGAAAAAPDPIGSGSVTILLDAAFRAQLRAAGVELRAEAPLKLRGGRATFPVSSGELDPTTGLGTVGLDGGLRLLAAGTRADLGSLVLDTARRQLVGNVAGRKLTLATLRGWSFRRDGFGVDMRVRGLALRGAAARHLSGRLGGRGGTALRAGRRLGSAHAEAQPRRLTLLPEGAAVLVLDHGIVEKLAANGVEVSALPPARDLGPSPAAPGPAAAPSFELPLAAGTVASMAGAATLDSAGSLRLRQPGPGDQPWPTVSLGTLNLELADNALHSDPWTRSLSADGAVATLAPVVANRLNATFVAPLEAAGRPAQRFGAEERLGTVSFAARAR